MGNTQTIQSSMNNTKDSSLLETLHVLAGNLIYTQSFTDLQKLTNQEYCRELTMLTSDILKDNFSTIELQKLDQSLQVGSKSSEIDEKKPRSVYFSFTSEDNNYNHESKTTSITLEKKSVCLRIAKFYIKLAHLYAAILETIHPVFTIRDVNGQNITINFDDIYKLDTETTLQNKNLKQGKLGLCYTRLYSTLSEYSKLTGSNTGYESNTNVSLQSNMCSGNMKTKYKSESGEDIGENMFGPIEINEVKNLMDEPGIPELKQLYMDQFNMDTNSFDSMSEVSKRQYKHDLELFYKVFTGNSVIPENIQDFKDIPLRDFSQEPGCKTGIYDQSYMVDTRSKLYVKYAEYMKQMLQQMTENETSLREILVNIFVQKHQQQQQFQKITINPEITYESLQTHIVTARNIIVKMYIQCEMNFINIVKTFQALVESNIMETTERQKTNLMKAHTQLLEG